MTQPILKILLLSLVISLIIKVVGPLVVIPADDIVAIAIVFSPVILVSFFLWQRA